MTILTTLETKVYSSIQKQTVDGGWGPELHELINDTGLNVKILRGVLGSLSKKNFIEVEPGNDGPDLYCDNHFINPEG